MVEVKTLSPILRHHNVELCAWLRSPHVERTVRAHWPCTGHAPCIVGWPKAVGVDQLAGPWPRRPLWPWAPLQPTETVNFSISFRIIQIKFNSNLI
jgi:hypothetical protein